MQSNIYLNVQVILYYFGRQINPLVSPFFLSKLFIHKLRFIDDGSSCFFVHILFTYSSVLGIKKSPQSLYIFAKSFVYGRLAACLSVLFCLLSNL